MGYDFCLKGCIHVRRKKTYPWPCPSDPKRTIPIWAKDVLSRQRKNRYTCHTGLCCINIHIPDADVVPFKKDCYLRLI